MRLDPQGQGPYIIWVGRIVPTARGSTIHLETRQTRLSRILSWAVAGLLALLVLAGGGTLMALLAFAVPAGSAFAAENRSSGQWPSCEAILFDVVQARAADKAPAT